MNSTHIRRRINAPRPIVYHALLDEHAIAKWKVPDGMTCQVLEFDAREGVVGQPHRGVSTWYVENWEDATGFSPYVGVDSASWTHWRTAVSKFEFARGATGFPYVDYYDALGRVRGIEARKGHAIAFDTEPFGKRRVLDAVP